MNRPGRIWALLALCFILILAALAWMTQHILSSENQRLQALEQADSEERIRLALARMDAVAAQFLLSENGRPPAQYQTLAASPPDLSPLLSEDSPYARLYFEIRDERRLSSPQAPHGETRATVLTTGFPEAKLRRYESDYQQLKRLLANRLDEPLDDEKSPLREIIQQAEKLEKGLALPQKKAAVSKAPTADFAKAQEINEYQFNRSLEEKASRAANYNQASRDQNKQNIENTRKVWDNSTSENLLSLGSLSPYWLGSELLLIRRVVSDQGPRTQGIWLNRQSLEKSLLASVNDLFPKAHLEKIDLLDTGELKSQTQNIDPSINLRQLSDPRILVTLPLRFLPEIPISASPIGWTPLRKSLALGWLATLLALTAAALLIRGVITLSERRASFVSSVTHELRTPLTTFRLYTEMLAEGMVSDPARKEDYLHTMLAESERLNHLIENVLAYSRLEKGSARRHLESLTPTQLAEKMEPVLRRRCAQAGANLRLIYLEKSAPWLDQVLQLDLTSIEQIIFNLVDNACKYGLPENEENPKITITFSQENNHLIISVKDQGTGISSPEKKRLFRPFHKSAQEAAESKPGVGLGLALSRRLARAMKGDLYHEKTEEKGCIFTLRLPAQK